MPHRVAILAGLSKLTLGVSGAAASVLAVWRIDPDHAKTMISAIGGAFLLLIYVALRDIAPLYFARRKEYAQLSADLQEIRRHAAEAASRQDQTDSRIEHNSDLIEAAKREAVDKALEVEREATRKRHELADRVQAQLVQSQADLLEAHLRIAEMERRLGVTAVTHAEAINTVADDVRTIADQMDPPVPVATPHLNSRLPGDGPNR